MAEQKPAARKKVTKRGPTKAASLKALGLTQEDLDAIKELKKIREVQAEEGGHQKDLVEAELRGRETAKAAVEEIQEARNAVTDDPEWSAAAPQAVGQDATPVSSEPVFFMRNLRGVEVAFRLSRQEDSRKRTTLKPRGQRGDMQKLEAADLKDAELRTQVAYNLVEIIPEGEALAAIEKQAINSSAQGARPLVDMLRGPLGERYEDPNPVKADEIPFEQQGTVVAHLNPQENSPTGELPSKGRGIDWQQARQIGGNPAIIQDGFAQQAPPSQDPNQAAMAADAVARQKGRQGPSAAGLSGVKVTVDPVQKS